MKAILQEHEEFGQEIIQKSIDEYIAILKREIALNDDAFREKVTALATLDSGDSLKSIAGFLANQKPPVLMPVYTQIPPHQETEDELQAALDLLRKLPTKRIPKPSPLPPNSRPPAFPPNPLFVGPRGRSPSPGHLAQRRQPGRHRAGRRRHRPGRHRQEPARRRVRPPLRPVLRRRRLLAELRRSRFYPLRNRRLRRSK